MESKTRYLFLTAAAVSSLLVSSIGISADQNVSLNFKDWSYTSSPSQRVFIVSADGNSVLTYGSSPDISLFSRTQDRCENTSVDLKFPDSLEIVGIRTQCKKLENGGAVYSFVPSYRPDFGQLSKIHSLMRKGSIMHAIVVGSGTDTRGPHLATAQFSLMGVTAALEHLERTPDTNQEAPYSSEWRLDGASIDSLARMLTPYTPDDVANHSPNVAAALPKRSSAPAVPRVSNADREVLKNYALNRVENDLADAICSSSKDFKVHSDTVFGADTIDPYGNVMAKPLPSMTAKITYLCINSFARTKKVQEAWTHVAIDREFNQVICVPRPYTEELVKSNASECGFRAE